jgi:MFS family permease
MVAVDQETRAESTSAWRTTAQGATALAAAMGVGRFVYTPILPLMHAQAGLSVQQGSALATANYAGYLVGALLGIAAPRAVRSRLTLHASLLVAAATLALMPATESVPAWLVLRLVAGVASALVFVVAVNAVLGALRAHGQHLTGWALGGVGAGIALSGALVLSLHGANDWRQAWWLAAALSLLLTIPAWSLRMPAEHGDDRVAESESAKDPAAPGAADAADERWRRRRFAGLFATYSLEGVG